MCKKNVGLVVRLFIEKNQPHPQEVRGALAAWCMVTYEMMRMNTPQLVGDCNFYVCLDMPLSFKAATS
jgi:hypothetical protein